MKIYNEIVFDVDGKVIYEDSYEYSGDVVLCSPPDFDYNKDGFVNIQDMFSAPEDEKGELWKRISAGSDEGYKGVLKEETQALVGIQTQASDIQANAMPSLPSISNVGSVAPTGVINWNAIPGGFQPLPQTAGGRKKLYQLSQFHGGINQKSSPRDIADFECQEATNVTFSKVGRIKPSSDFGNNDNGITLNAVSTTDRCLPGYGLFQFTAPAAADGTTGETVITLSADGNGIDYSDSSGNGAFANFSTGSNVATLAHIFYAAGNGVYIADASLQNGSTAKIYVYRKDYNSSGTAANLITSAWVEGKILINSPTFEAATGGGAAATDGRVALEFKDGSASFAVTTTAGAATVHVGSTGIGTWNGNYFFYISWLFDGGVETGLTALQSSGGATFANEILNFNFSVEDNNSSRNHIGGDSRIEGARIYFKKSGTAERFLLAEVSLIDGVKGALDSTFVPWAEPATDTFDLASNILFENPPEVYSYASLNGYYANEVYTKSSDELADEATGPTAIDVKYKTVVVGQAGTVFIGNVNFDGRHMPDSMMFSMPGKPGVFPKLNTFDSPSSDGSPITALASFRDTILQFKENGLYVINVSNPAQFYAQSSFRDCGVFNPCQVFTTSFGVIFVNKHGCFIYDGQKVISLTGGKFDWISQSDIVEETSNASDACLPCVGYDPRSQSIIVLKDIGDNTSTASATDEGAWVYDMPTQSWTEGADMIENGDGVRHTNFIITSGGYLSILDDSSTALENYDHASGSSQTITYTTKDIDFGLPTQTKKIFKIYVTYRGNGSGVTVTYGPNGDTNPGSGALTNSENSGSTLTSADVTDHNVATFTLNSHPAALKSIALKFTGSAAADFEINDISILYRVRPIK